MKISPTCVPCLLNRIIFEGNQSKNNKRIQTKIIRNACEMLSDLYNPTECSADIATKVHKKTYEMLNDPDPYKILKEKSNKVAASFIPIVEKKISHSSDPLRTAFLASIVGNTLDFGIAGGSSQPDELKQVFEKIFDEGIKHDDSDKVKSILKKSSSILYFTDNSGEIVFDKLVFQQLKKSYPDLLIFVVVKGEPVLSDATLKDVDMLDLRNVVDDVFTTDCFAVGVNFALLPAIVKEKLNEVDLIMCKGMANYESFSEKAFHPIVYLLRSKCQPIASSMQVPVHANIVKLYD